MTEVSALETIPLRNVMPGLMINFIQGEMNIIARVDLILDQKWRQQSEKYIGQGEIYM